MTTGSTYFGWLQLVGRRISLRQKVLISCLIGFVLSDNAVLMMKRCKNLPLTFLLPIIEINNVRNSLDSDFAQLLLSDVKKMPS